MTPDVMSFEMFIKEEQIPEKDIPKLRELLGGEPEQMIVFPEWEYDTFWWIFGMGMNVVIDDTSGFIDKKVLMEKERKKYKEFKYVEKVGLSQRELSTTYYLQDLYI